MLEKESYSIKYMFTIVLIVIWLFAGVQVVEPIIQNYAKSDYEEPVVRVIANSNLKRDVEFKQQVAKQVETTNIPINQFNMFQNFKQFEIESEKPSQQIKAETSQATIPPKMINGRFYPQTNTSATIIKIGQGRGENWFCGFFYRACGYENKKQWQTTSKKRNWWRKT